MQTEEEMRDKYPITMGWRETPFPCQRKKEGARKEDLYYVTYCCADISSFFRKWTTLKIIKIELHRLISAF